ncbi:MAG: PTS IIA-like nitrogen regulatory protein PtsN [Pseudomonadota bacterium]
MDLSKLFQEDSVVVELKATSKKQVLFQLCERAADMTGLSARDVLDVILDRERLGTTGVGDGVAIPHGKIEGLDRIVGVFARLAEPIDFDAVDGEPVDLICLLLAPASAGAEHLKALACVARLLRDQNMCDKLRGSGEADALYALLTDDTAHAA